MTNQKDHSEVNSSYTTFFLISCVSFSVIFGRFIPKYSSFSIITLIIFSLILYLTWDLIKQLYSPNQAVIIFVITFIIMPGLMNLLLDFPYARLGTIIIILSYITAGLLELIYESIIKRNIKRKKIAGLLLIDNNIDKSMIEFSNKYLYLNSFIGMLSAMTLAILYFVATYLLFHKH